MINHFWGLVITAGALLSATVLTGPARADSAKILGKFGRWSSYAYSDRAGKICYAATVPERSLNAPKRRGEVFLSVTDRTADHSIGVVSVTEGYAYKKDASAEIDIDGKKFGLFTTGNSAWARDDKAVVRTMMNGKTMLVYGTPVKGGQSVDTYSLDGFAKAIAETDRACRLK
jgi:hypothetical protein